MARKFKGSINLESPFSSPPRTDSHSPPCKAEDEDTEEEMEETEEEMEDTEEEMEDTEEEIVEDDEEKNGIALSWPKNDDLELFKRIRKACPKDDALKYNSRVNHLNWESIKYQDYSAEQCKNRWLHVQNHLRHYRILAEVLEDAALWVDRQWYNFNKGGKNKHKHPEQPKKPLTSYMMFYMEQKDAFLEKQPGLGFTELSKIIAKMYNALSDRKKTRYSVMAEKEKKIYQEKMKKFMDDHPDYICPKSKNAKAVPPKLPTPFKLFRDEKMAKFLAEGITSTEARGQCRDAYRKLKDKQKLKWIYQALEQEKGYYEKLEKFKAEYPDVDLPAKKLSLLTKDELQIKHKYEGKPKKPPHSGYNLFSKKLLSGNSLKQFKTKERMTEIGRQWKELTSEERASYNNKATQMSHSYKMKYASYFDSLKSASSADQTMKRTAEKKEDEQLVGKKQKKSAAVSSSSEVESKEDEASDEDDFDVFSKTTIQKPISSLQMFCNSNMDKYSSRHPKLTKQELTRLLAKEFAKLGEKKKKIYGNMALRSKKKSSASRMASAALTPKTKTSKTAVSSKEINGKSATTASVLKSPERGSSLLKPATNSDSKLVKSPLKSIPTLNANNVKVTAEASSKTLKSAVWASNQSREDGDNQSSDEEFSQSSSNEDQVSVACSDDEPEISSDED